MQGRAAETGPQRISIGRILILTREKQRTMKKTAIIITLVTLVAVGIAAAFSVKCSFCNGTGWRSGFRCNYCGGDGDIGK